MFLLALLLADGLLFVLELYIADRLGDLCSTGAHCYGDAIRHALMLIVDSTAHNLLTHDKLRRWRVFRRKKKENVDVVHILPNEAQHCGVLCLPTFYRRKEATRAGPLNRPSHSPLPRVVRTGSVQNRRACNANRRAHPERPTTHAASRVAR